MKTIIIAVLATLAIATSVSAAPILMQGCHSNPEYVSTHGVWDCR